METPSVKTILAPTIIQGFVIFRTLMINVLEITSKKPFVGMIENFGRLLMAVASPGTGICPARLSFSHKGERCNLLRS